MARRGRIVPTNCVQIEYLVVTFDDNNQKVRLSLCQAEVLKALAKDEELSKNGGCVPDLQPK
jgi:glutamate--cysteine ligase catalytic subunit